MKKILLAITIALALAGCSKVSKTGSPFSGAGSANADADGLAFSSPNGNVKASFYVDESGRLSLSVNRTGTAIIEKCDLGIIVDGVDYGQGAKMTKMPSYYKVDRIYPWRGVKSQAIDKCNGITIPIDHASGRWTLEARAYDDGFAFRYILPGNGNRKINGEATAWQLPADAMLHFMTQTYYYEGPYIKHMAADIPLTRTEGRNKRIVDLHMAFPTTMELADGTYAALTEANVMGYSGMTLRPTGTEVVKGVFEDNAEGWDADGQITSPWRIVMAGPDLNALVNCDIVHNVCPSYDKALFPDGFATEWLRPGRSLWQWWAYNNPGTHWSTQKGFIDNAAKLGCDYYLVDEGWEHPRQEWFAEGESPWVKMKELHDYAKTKGIDLWIWKAWKYNKGRYFPGIETKEKREEFFAKCAEVGIVGVKIDFMNSESHDVLDFYQDCLRIAAKHKIMVNFHGANKPAGETKTWPNEMAREGIKGLEHNKWSDIPPSHYVTVPFTRLLAGHGDFTPITLQPEFLKGTTPALQMATCVMYTSPFLCWADKPEVYLESPIVDFMKTVPTLWDETVVLPGCKIGEFAAFARRNGDDWYVTVINGKDDSVKDYELSLSFLKGGDYSTKYFGDNMKDMTKLNIQEPGDVNGSSTLAIKMQPGGGFVGVFTKK